MDIKRAGSQPSSKGSGDYFTGTVRIDPLFQAPAPARVSGAAVTFEPGARTAWHTHPLGQTLVVTAGFGRVQRWGDPIAEIQPGDVVWLPAGEKHWHGASPTTALTHIAVQEQLDGKSVGWNRSAMTSTSLIEARNEERAMPHVIVKLWPGKSEQQKRRLAEAITRDVATVLNYGDESVSVALEEVTPAEWAEKVYRPDTVEKAATLYKKPGYTM